MLGLWPRAGVRVAGIAGAHALGLAPTATRSAYARGHPWFRNRDTVMARPVQCKVPAKRLDGRALGVAYTMRGPDIDVWSPVGLMVNTSKQAAAWTVQGREKKLAREVIGSYTKHRAGCVHANVQLWTR
jgi:hypothetical protein